MSDEKNVCRIGGQWFELAGRGEPKKGEWFLHHGPIHAAHDYQVRHMLLKPIDPPTLPASPEERDVEALASAAEQMFNVKKTVTGQHHALTHYSAPYTRWNALEKALVPFTREVEREVFYAVGVAVMERHEGGSDALVVQTATTGYATSLAAKLNQLHSETSEGKA